MIFGVALALAGLSTGPGGARLADTAAAASGRGVLLQVPVIRQSPERCGPASLRMVMRYEHAAASAEAFADSAYDPILRGALITELAAAARRAGFDAEVETPSADSLVALLAAGVPPILLIDVGIGPLQKGHYVVLVGGDDTGHFTIHDGSARPRTLERAALVKRWRAAGGQALVVRPK